MNLNIVIDRKWPRGTGRLLTTWPTKKDCVPIKPNAGETLCFWYKSFDVKCILLGKNVSVTET